MNAEIGPSRGRRVKDELALSLPLALRTRIFCDDDIFSLRPFAPAFVARYRLLGNLALDLDLQFDNKISVISYITKNIASQSIIFISVVAIKKVFIY